MASEIMMIVIVKQWDQFRESLWLKGNNRVDDSH